MNNQPQSELFDVLNQYLSGVISFNNFYELFSNLFYQEAPDKNLSNAEMELFDDIMEYSSLTVLNVRERKSESAYISPKKHKEILSKLLHRFTN